MRPALAETRTAFAAQTAAFTVALPEDDAAKDVATTIVTLEKHDKAKATPPSAACGTERRGGGEGHGDVAGGKGMRKGSAHPRGPA